MSETPEGGFTLDWIGRTLLEMQREQRAMKDEQAAMKEEQAAMRQELTAFREDSSLRFRDVEAGLFRADAAWRALQGELKALRAACEQILHWLKAEQRY